MTEQQYGGVSAEQVAVSIASPEFRRVFASAGVTAAEAIERARAGIASIDWSKPIDWQPTQGTEGPMHAPPFKLRDLLHWR